MGRRPRAGLLLLGLMTLLWMLGLGLRTSSIVDVGDGQLARFKGDPATAADCSTREAGGYSRHPNYFGDTAQGFYLIAAAAGGAWTVFSPAIMTLLLVRASGVGLLEKTLKDGKAGYRDYMERTSPFVPWVPRPSR